MNKSELLEVLRAVLLWFDGELPTSYGVAPKFSKVGIKLADTLKKHEIKEEGETQ